jgi:hypothetical protein
MILLQPQMILLKGRLLPAMNGTPAREAMG